MDRASEALFKLNPVTFRYKRQIDPAGTGQFGLVAEEVEKVNPDLVVRDKEGKPYSVRYDQVNAMLVNEFLKEHRIVQEQGRKLQEQEATIAQQRKDFEATISELKKGMETLALRSKEQDVKIQKVGDRMELTAAAKQLAVSK
jgi:septal ring factor EnvC (AmiA/AmiB activator)